jgi:hypothetical protein
MTESTVDEMEELVLSISRMLHGHRPEVQSAVLADLVAMWLAGFLINTDAAKLQEELLEEFVKLVRGLIRPNEQQLFDRLKHGDLKEHTQ